MISLSIKLRPLFNILFSGDKYIDPINEKSYSKFFPYGYNKTRRNALSLGTLSLERHRLLWLYLKNETSFFNQNNKILHVAPEQCFYDYFKKHFENYFTADLNSPLAEYKVDVCDLPFQSDSFDFVLCNHVLEHVQDDRKVMKEFYRVIKKGGWGIFQVPIDTNRKKTFDDPNITEPKEREKHYWQEDHVRL